MSNTTGKHTPNKHLDNLLVHIHKEYGIGIIITVCMQCETYYGVKDGEGQYGVSHGLCPSCLKDRKQAIKKFKESI